MYICNSINNNKYSFFYGSKQSEEIYIATVIGEEDHYKISEEVKRRYAIVQEKIGAKVPAYTCNSDGTLISLNI